MSVLILPAAPFSLRSCWVSRGGAAASLPSAARKDVRYAVSSLPRGCAVESASLAVCCDLPDGGTFLIAGSPLLSQDVTALLRTDGSGGYRDLTIPFFFRASAGQERRGFFEAFAAVTSAVLTVSYTGPSEGAEAPPDPSLFSSPARDLLPEALLSFPDGSLQQVGPDSILSFRLDRGTDEGPLLGRACAAMLSVRLANTAGEWFPGGAMRQARPLLGAWLRLSLRAGEGGPAVLLGSFRIEEMEGSETGLFLELRGFDAMACRTDGPYVPPQTLPVTLSELLSHLAAQCGLQLSGALPVNGGVSCQATPAALPDCTFRQALGFICQAGGAFACVTPDGVLRVSPAFPQGGAFAVPPEAVLSLSHDERTFSFAHLRVLPFETDGLGTALTLPPEDGTPLSGLDTLLIRDNPLFPRQVTQTFELARGLSQALSGAGWQALDLCWRGDPTVPPGAPLEVVTPRGARIFSLLTGETLLWDRGLSARARCPVREDDPVR